MYIWNDIETKTEIEFIFNILKEKIKDSKIKRIFSADDRVPEKNNNEIIYDMLEEPLYILFDNDYCLIINFIFYSLIHIEYRKISSEELKKHISSVNKNEIDYFNGHHEVYGWDFDNNGKRIEESFRIKHIIDTTGEYDKILSFQVNGFHNEYNKWISNGDNSSLITIPAGGDYFNVVKITLKNGIKIKICPQPAENDGYYDLIIEGINYNKICLK